MTGASEVAGGESDPLIPAEPVLDPSGEMAFMEHLAVLRKHVFRATIWFALAACIGFYFVDRAWDVLMIPLCELRPQQCYVYPRDLMESFWVYLKLGALLALFISSPALFAELWAFVAPGLYKHERRLVLPFSLAVGVLFAAGAAFGFFAVFPTAFKFFFGLEKENGFVYLLSMKGYFSLCATLLIAFGVVFELPLVMMMICGFGLVTPRWFRRYRRFMYLGMLVFSAVVTPTTDPVTMILMGGPMILLYEIGILLGAMVYRERLPPNAESEGAPRVSP